MPSNILPELEARGLLADVTDREALGALLASEPVTFYAGYDPTAISLHAGNLVPISVATRLARAGHKMIAVVGGATGVVGDPSGKSAERQLLGKEQLAKNVAALDAQIRRFVSADAIVVNNHDWFGPITFLDFLRDVGKHITVNYMLAKESVRARLEDRDQGISYTEFSYMLLQGYDYVHLARTYGCRLQLGGGDQWGNITCGCELYRKIEGPDKPPIYGLTAPLLLTAAGTKFGKSEKGQNVWLDATMTPPYNFYQYWLNADDADAEKYLKMFTFLPLDEIAELMREHDVDRAKRIAQRRLAFEVTSWVHGAEIAKRVVETSQGLFSKDHKASLADMVALDPSLAVDLPRVEIEAGISLIDLLVRAGLTESKSEGRRLLNQGGVYVNDVRIEDVARIVTVSDLTPESMILLRSGKKKIRIVRAGGH